MTTYLDELAPLAGARRELATELQIEPTEVDAELAARFSIVCEAMSSSFVSAEVLGYDPDVLSKFLAIARRRLRDAPTELLS